MRQLHRGAAVVKLGWAVVPCSRSGLTQSTYEWCRYSLAASLPLRLSGPNQPHLVTCDRWRRRLLLSRSKIWPLFLSGRIHPFGLLLIRLASARLHTPPRTSPTRYTGHFAAREATRLDLHLSLPHNSTAARSASKQPKWRAPTSPKRITRPSSSLAGNPPWQAASGTSATLSLPS